MSTPNDATVSDKDTGKKGEADEALENDGETSTDDGKDGQGKKSKKTFDEDQVNAIVEKRLKKAKDSWEKEKDLTEAERLKAQNETLTKQLNEKNAFDDFDSFFGKKGVKNTRGLFRALKGDLEFDANGKVSNLKTLLDDAKADFGEFFTTVQGDADGKKGEGDKGKTKSFSDSIRRGFGR